ncbi:5'-AMP-activated protein kinase subunit beta-2 isoform X3 [Neovison vison]|uniref:5'-AMP-activated protein kinase subunit beta-2 isoform X3 n=1 Tax=Neovison vison TaxID=452646 RepID=UPI001CF07513|nr:5'-AMP-activated protein kinase subunit beta-2 isoform X3 [Neogale vison]
MPGVPESGPRLELQPWETPPATGWLASATAPSLHALRAPAAMRRARSIKSWWGVPTILASSACRTPSHNDFVAILDLPEGEHQYKFFVDGQWVHDPSEPVVTSQLGTINNLIHVKKSDFEVFDALKLDSMESSETSCRDLSSSPPGPYGQEMYVFRSEERFKSPPILPPHLLQVILNKDTNISCDPALLPEPNHVMLNHLYALSIKDSVMVLSATHRYKKKYVTTLLYKPI